MMVSSAKCNVIFQLTPSRRATTADHEVNYVMLISTHALTEGDRKSCVMQSRSDISTHALTEGDEGRTSDRVRG